MTNNPLLQNLQYLYITVPFRSLDDSPGIPAFIGREKRASPVANLTSVVSEMAGAITSQRSRLSSSQVVHSPAVSAQASSGPSASTGISPRKTANLQSNYLQQTRELHTLFECGALTQPGFLEQKRPTLEQLNLTLTKSMQCL